MIFQKQDTSTSSISINLTANKIPTNDKKKRKTRKIIYLITSLCPHKLTSLQIIQSNVNIEKKKIDIYSYKHSLQNIHIRACGNSIIIKNNEREREKKNDP